MISMDWFKGTFYKKTIDFPMKIMGFSIKISRKTHDRHGKIYGFPVKVFP